jgi:hypothetical protein
MGHETLPTDHPATDTADERKLRGIALNGSERLSVSVISSDHGKRLSYSPLSAAGRVRIGLHSVQTVGDLPLPFIFV